jgi:hypothetical protein
MESKVYVTDFDWQSEMIFLESFLNIYAASFIFAAAKAVVKIGLKSNPYDEF